jgi:hypothetical protein
MFYVFVYNSTKYYTTVDNYSKLSNAIKTQFKDVNKRSYVSSSYTEWK